MLATSRLGQNVGFHLGLLNDLLVRRRGDDNWHGYVFDRMPSMPVSNRATLSGLGGLAQLLITEWSCFSRFGRAYAEVSGTFGMIACHHVASSGHRRLDA